RSFISSTRPLAIKVDCKTSNPRSQQRDTTTDMPPKRRIPPNEAENVPGSPSKRARFADSVIDNESKASSKKLMAAARKMDNNRASGSSRANYSTNDNTVEEDTGGDVDGGGGDAFADQVDSTLDIMGTSSKKKGKGRVKVEGYESD
ncbi:7097_t:CDS:1, partial [Acaulospora colombiana]